MSFILNMLGWEPRIKVKGLSVYKKSFVGCLSHTSGVHEFILYWLFCQINLEFRKNFCLVLAGKNNSSFKKQPKKWILSKINLIFLDDKRWKKSQNSVNTIVEEIRKKNYKYVILSPEGKDQEPRPWKSGYYYIGQKLGWGYRAVGFDFETKRLKFGPYVSTEKNLEETQKILQFHMGDIVPLQIENSPIPIRQHNPDNINFIEKTILVVPVALIIFSIILIFHLRKQAEKKIGNTIFHIILSLYGLYLQTNENILINYIGLSIIYAHVFVIYLGFPRLPENIIIIGALVGMIIGIIENDSTVYIPLMYSLLSKIPRYAKNMTDQAKAILTTLILVIIVQKTLQQKPLENSVI